MNKSFLNLKKVFGGLKKDNVWLKYQKNLQNSQLLKIENIDENIADKISCAKVNSKKYCSLERPRSAKLSVSIKIK